MELLAKLQRPVGILALLALGVGLWLVFNAPADFQQGKSVRIMYVHVPSAKLALFSFIVLLVASVIYLLRKSQTADIIAEAVVPVGALFSAITLATGSIWGKPMWGAWWAWDARLTSMLVLLIIYIGLMALRNALDNPVKGAKAAAILTIVGALDLPIIHFSVVWWRTLHQPASVSGPGKISISGPLLLPLIAMAVAFMLMGAYMLIINARAVAAQRALEEIEARRYADE